MIYLKDFQLLNDEEELGLIDNRRIHNNTYPFGIFSSKNFHDIAFDDITIFYGGNGSGKSTLLNIIASKLDAKRKNQFDKGVNFERYVGFCKHEMHIDEPLEIKSITSDDIFDSLLDVRAINANVSRKKEQLSKEWLKNKYDDSLDYYDTYESLKDNYDAKRKTMSAYVRSRLANNTIIENSNGESALLFWEKEIKEDSIYKQMNVIY